MLLSILLGTSRYNVFVDFARLFILVIIYLALLDCLFVDIFIGSLYNYISNNYKS